MAGGVFLSSCFDQKRLEIVKCRVKMSAGNGTVASRINYDMTRSSHSFRHDNSEFCVARFRLFDCSQIFVSQK